MLNWIQHLGSYHVIQTRTAPRFCFNCSTVLVLSNQPAASLISLSTIASTLLIKDCIFSASLLRKANSNNYIPIPDMTPNAGESYLAPPLQGCK